MTASHDPDKQFDENLRRIGRGVSMPQGPSADVRSRCAAALNAAGKPTNGRILKMIKKPAVLSAFGAAAILAFVVGMLFPWNGTPAAYAALIVEKLEKQSERAQLMEVTLEGVRVDAASLNGHLQLSQQGIAGDVQIGVDEGEGRIEIDASLGLTSGSGWVLIRGLSIPDPRARMIISMFLPPGGETLLLLPAGALDNDFGVDFGDPLKELRSENVIGILKQLIENHADYGVTLERQGDGTVLLSLTIDDDEAFQGLARLIMDVGGVEQQITAELKAEISGADGDVRREEILRETAVEIEGALGGEMDELLGASLAVTYDPATEQVRSFSITDVGPMKGTIVIALRDGEIDPALLDSARVAGPNTRTLDLNALESMFENMKINLK